MGSWRKKTYLFGTVSLALCTVALSGMLHNGHVHAKDEIHRAPVLSGTLETTLYVGDEFDAKKLYNRVLADDLEDGDLTYQIEEVFNDVDTSKAGNHKIQYQVTDSDGNTDILETAVKVVEKESGTEKTIKRELYTLGDASHLTSIGFNRGYGHDRQSLGILLSENGELQIRLVNADEFKDNLEVTFINQDKLTQSTGIIPSSGEWVTLKNTYKVTDENNVESQESRVSVPFIKTPKNKKVQPIIEFKWTEDTKEIPYYRYKDKEDDFFAKWEEIDTPYAIIEGSAATFLVPVVDREKIIGFPGENNPAYRFNTIDEMLEWYADFIEFYDEMVGLDYEAGEFYNQNVRSKFFIYANENGYGQAYYSGDHSAFNGPTLDTYLTKSWLALHEFAHGYEGWLASQEYSLVETTNNILAYYFQQTFLTEGDWGWLLGQYAGENRKERWAKMEEWALKYRQETSTFNEIVKDGEKHYDVSLYMFINLFEKIGEKEGTSAMHSLYRKMANAEGKFLSTGDAIIQ